MAKAAHQIEDFKDTEVKKSTTSETPLDRLSQRVKVSLRKDPKRYIVDNIAGMVISCDVNLRLEQLNAWQMRSKRRNPSGQRVTDPVVFNAMIIASQVQEVYIDDELLTGKSGEPLRLTDPEFIASVGLDPDLADEESICKVIFGSEAGVIRYGDRIVSDSGFNDEAIDTDELGKARKR